jgi:hypothetical protein
LIAVFNVSGIDDTANNTLSRGGNTTRPKIALNFELTRTGHLNLAKAEAKMTETYTVDERILPAKKNKTTPNVTVTTEGEEAPKVEPTETPETTEPTDEDLDKIIEEPKPEEPKFITKTKKRTHTYPLVRISKEFIG